MEKDAKPYGIMPHLPKPKPRNYIPKPKRKDTGFRKLYDSAKWHKKRKTYPQKHGFQCQACKYAKIDTPESYICDLDHIVSIDHEGDHLDDRNLNRLCKEHHHKKSAMERNTGKPLIEAIKNERGYLIPLNKSDLWELLIK